MIRLIKRSLASVFDLFLPNRCLQCSDEIEADTAYLCGNCWNALPLFPERTGEPFQSLRGVLDKLWVGWTYDDTVRRLIYLFKYSGRPDIAETIVSYWMDALPAQHKIFDVDLLVPVPIHSARRRHRGFNQSEALVEEIAKIHAIPVNTQALRRSINTPSQTKLDRTERWKSVADAFLIENQDIFQDKRVLIVDDLATSGATLHALAGLFHKCQAKSVSAAVLTSPYTEGSST
ncbi:ComF family protein [bacterium]|nr:ComF family protein [bacterium]